MHAEELVDLVVGLAGEGDDVAGEDLHVDRAGERTVVADHREGLELSRGEVLARDQHRRPARDRHHAGHHDLLHSFVELRDQQVPGFHDAGEPVLVIQHIEVRGVARSRRGADGRVCIAHGLAAAQCHRHRPDERRTGSCRLVDVNCATVIGDTRLSSIGGQLVSANARNGSKVSTFVRFALGHTD
jgi:hypothetical protein